MDDNSDKSETSEIWSGRESRGLVSGSVRRVIVEVQAWAEMSALEWDCIPGPMVGPWALRKYTFGDLKVVCHYTFPLCSLFLGPWACSKVSIIGDDGGLG
jgi:hypothetical protein